MRRSETVRGGKGRRSRGPHIYKRGAVWWAYVDRDTRVSLETGDEAEARAKLADALRDAERARAARGRPGEETLAVIAKAYLDAPHGWTRGTLLTTRARLVAFVEAMQTRGAAYPSQVTLARLDAWREVRMVTRARATINRDETVARQLFRWALRRGMVQDNPLAAREQLRQIRRTRPPLIPSPREVASVVASLDGDGERGAALLLATALATGLRLDELRHLRPEHVDDGGVSVVPEAGPAGAAWTSKGYRERRIPCGPGAVETAREFALWRTEGKGGKRKPVGLAGQWVARKIDAGRAGASVEKFRMHDLRRVFATECVRNGIAITLVREWMGHRDVQTTERYLGRYREDAAVQAPTPAALDVLKRAPATVVPISRRKGR